MQAPTVIIYDEIRPHSFVTGWPEIGKHFKIVLLNRDCLNVARNIDQKVNILTKIIKRYKIKLIHIHGVSFTNLISLYLAARRLELPIIATLHTYKLVCPLLNYVKYPEFTPCLRPYFHADCIECIVSYCKIKKISRDKVLNKLLGLAGLEIYRWIYKDFDLIITPSRILADIMRSKLGFSNVVVLRNPLNPYLSLLEINLSLKLYAAGA